MFGKKYLMGIFSLIISIALILPACGQTEAEAGGSITVTDGTEEEVSLEGAADKVIVFAPSVLEVIDALGAMDQVIGVDSWSIESGEPLAQGFEAYGDYNGPNIEKITEAQPDVVIKLSGSSEEDYDRLRELGITIYTVEAQSFERAYQEIINLGQMLGKEEEAQKLKDEFEAGVEEVYQQVKDLSEEKKPLAFYQIFDDPLWSAGKNTYIDDMIEKAGGINIVAKDGLDGYVEYSVEKLLENNPQVMIAGDGGMYEARSGDIILQDERFSSVDAVLEGNVYIVPQNPVVRPNHNSVKGLKMMAMAFHPEIFGQFEIIE
ncbi:MAG: ABC transporter substrate-binding protein [Actinomycetota bacterium]